MTNEEFDKWLKAFQERGYMMIDETDDQDDLIRFLQCLDELQVAAKERSIELK